MIYRIGDMMGITPPGPLLKTRWLPSNRTSDGTENGSVAIIESCLREFLENVWFDMYILFVFEY